MQVMSKVKEATFKVGDNVKIINSNERFNGLTGKITNVSYEISNFNYELNIEPIYIVKYDNSLNSGMFPESCLEKI